MNKIFKMIGMLVLAVAFVLGFSNLGLSSTMMPPDNETHAVKTTVSVVVSGTLTETESYKVNKALATTNSAEVAYSENLRTIHGNATLDKTFESSTSATPDVKVTKDWTYIATDPAGIGENTEKIGLVRVQPQVDNVGWCTHCLQTVPPACEAVAMGSSVSGDVVTSHTRSEADLFGKSDELPVLSHTIDASTTYATDEGIVGGTGTIKAGMVMDILEGPFDGAPTTTEKYVQHTTASGTVLKFKKSMSYKSQVPKAHLPMPWTQVP